MHIGNVCSCEKCVSLPLPLLPPHCGITRSFSSPPCHVFSLPPPLRAHWPGVHIPRQQKDSESAAVEDSSVGAGAGASSQAHSSPSPSPLHAPVQALSPPPAPQLQANSTAPTGRPPSGRAMKSPLTHTSQTGLPPSGVLLDDARSHPTPPPPSLSQYMSYLYLSVCVYIHLYFYLIISSLFTVLAIYLHLASLSVYIY